MSTLLSSVGSSMFCICSVTRSAQSGANVSMTSSAHRSPSVSVRIGTSSGADSRGMRSLLLLQMADMAMLLKLVERGCDSVENRADDSQDEGAPG